MLILLTDGPNDRACMCSMHIYGSSVCTFLLCYLPPNVRWQRPHPCQAGQLDSWSCNQSAIKTTVMTDHLLGMPASPTCLLVGALFCLMCFTRGQIIRRPAWAPCGFTRTPHPDYLDTGARRSAPVSGGRLGGRCAPECIECISIAERLHLSTATALAARSSSSCCSLSSHR